MHAFTGPASEWNSQIASLPDPHLLQTWEWSQVKAKYGWEPLPFVWHGETIAREPVAAAMILKKKVISRGFAARLCLLYVPKGPLMDWADGSLRQRVLDDMQSFARKQGGVFLKIDPDVVVGTGFPDSVNDRVNAPGQGVLSDLARRGWKESSDQIQFRNTVMLDLTLSEEQMLKRMKQKTRYNVRLAEKKGVTVRVATPADLPLLYKMYAETSVRDGFVIRDEGYYQTVWQTFMKAGEPRCEPLVAEVDGEPVAALFLFLFAGRAYYIYGMSREVQREKMPTYLLQWEAIKRAKTCRCRSYDLWGAPDQFNEADGLWGVYRFKEGLGGEVVRTLGAWDYAPNNLWYTMYAQVMPKVLDIMRSRGKEQTRQSLE
jgi:peptidoglycan pentaglycine glycine transferase (the first glycine)